MTATSTTSSATKKSTKNALVPRLRFPEFEGSGEWERTTIEKSCDLLNNHRAPIRASNRISGPIPYYGASGIVDYIDDYIFDDELLLVGEDGAKWGAFENTAFIVRGKCWVNNHAHVLKPHLLNILFLEAYLIKIDLFPYVTGAAPPKLTLTQLKSITIPLPSLPEQQKIADCLSSLDDLIAAEAEKLETLKVHKKGLMQELFPREGETTPRIRFPEFEGSGVWEVKRLGEVGEIITGRTPNTSIREYYGGENLFVSPADISDARFVQKTKTTLSSSGFSRTRAVKARSTLFVCIGSTIGKTAQVRQIAATNQQINSIVPNDKFASDFIFYLASYHSKKISELAGTHAVPIINKTLFSSYRVLTPNFFEQQKISSVLSSLDDRITAQAERIEALKAHKKGLMQQLFPVMEG